MNEKYYTKTFSPWLYDLVNQHMVQDHPDEVFYLDVETLDDIELKEFLGHVIEYHNFDADILNKECVQFFRDRLLNPRFICGDENELIDMMERCSLNNYRKTMQELINDMIPAVAHDRIHGNGLEYEGYDE